MANATADQLHPTGFTPESIGIGIGRKLKRSACGPEDAPTEPGWTMAPQAEGAPRAFSCPNAD